MILEIILMLSIIPFIDKYFTRLIYDINFLKPISNSKFIKTYLLNFNLIVNFIFIFFYPIRLFFIYIVAFELIFINTILKFFINRPRPKNTFLSKKSKYYGLKDFYFSLKDNNNKSFVSSHVSTIYLTYCMLNYLNNPMKYLYLILLFLVFICRINKGSHYFSDCCYGILFCNLFIIISNLNKKENF